MEIEVLLDLIELILTQKDEPGAFAGAISRRKFCLPYFDYLLSKGFLPDGVALLAATKMRQIEAARFVLEKGVRPTLESFQYAAEHQFFVLCSLFVEFGSREILSNLELEEELKFAIDNCRHQRAMQLINKGVNFTVVINEGDLDCIQAASSSGMNTTVHLLLKHGANPATGNNLAIKLASERGHLEVVRLLLQYGADPTTNNNYAIRWASARGHLEVVRLLLDNDSKYKVDPTAMDNYAIKHASGRRKNEIIELLKEHEASF
jgi:ankyrin repeat protein